VEYFTYGLPTLIPEWRHDPRLAAGSIYYNENNFLEVVKEYSDQEKWTKKSDEAIAIANGLSLDKAFEALKTIIEKETTV
jgi:hypothetical protein